jgi:hypothetical protein
MSQSPGQHMPPHVWYGTTCSLIRSTSGKCLAWLCGKGLFVSPVIRKISRGPSVGNFSNVRGPSIGTLNNAREDHLS